jgi:hypothetical protein
MTSLKPNHTPMTSYEPVVRILDERDMLCDEPEEMEPVPMAEKNESGSYGNVYNPWKPQHTASPMTPDRRMSVLNSPYTTGS